MRAFDGAAKALASQGARTLDFVPRFVPLATHAPVGTPTYAQAQGPVVAVDGSHAVLADNGTAWVVAHRAVALRWPGPLPRLDPLVTAATPEVASRTVGRPVAGADAFGQALRAQAEADALLGAIRGAAAGSLVLADGALRGLPPDAQAVADAAVALARQRGVRLVGVSKRSALERGGTPLVPALHAAGPAAAWAVEVDDGVFVARLHAAAPFAFRVDADAVADVGALLPLCRDAAYVGYPYPLAKAHNAVALTASVVTELRAGLERELRRQGAGAVLAARDFHDTLDRNVAG